MMKKATWGLLLAVALGSGVAAMLTMGSTEDEDGRRPRPFAEASAPTSLPAATRRAPSVERAPTPISRASIVAENPPEAPEGVDAPPAPPATLSVGAVQRVVADELRDLQLDAEVLVKVSCPAPPRCIAELSGPQFKSNIALRIAEALSESTGTEYEVATTSFSHVQAGSPDPTHATFASFFPAGESRSDANDEVRQAVQAFKADLEAQED